MNAEARLKQLHDAATPGPWSNVHGVALYETANDFPPVFDPPWHPESEANTALACTLRNALLEIIQLAGCVRTMLEHDKLSRYANNTCGDCYDDLEAALAALDEKVKP